MVDDDPQPWRWLPYVIQGVLLSVWGWWLVQPLPFFPTGVDWTQYIAGAEYIWHSDPSVLYPAWRKPLYPYLLGLFAVDSYAQAARTLNGMGFLLMGVASVWFAQGRRSPWIAVWLMAMLTVHPLLIDARDWINPYPLWGGCVSMMLSLALTISRTARWWHWGVLSGFTAVAVALDGRSWMVVLPMLCWLTLICWRKVGLIVLGVGFAIGVEVWFLQRFDIATLSLWEMLLEQRAYLFREGMALQLFPETSNNVLVAAACQDSSPIVSLSMDWSCAIQMGWTNWYAWTTWRLIPHWGLCLVALGWYGYQWRSASEDKSLAKGVFFGSMILGHFAVSLLVWQPPRYLLLTTWLLLAVMAWFIDQVRQRYRWSIVVTFPMVIGWFVTAVPLSSQDRPQDWNTTGRLLSEQVGQKILNCTPRPFTLSQMTRRRPYEWQVDMNPAICAEWMGNEIAQKLGIDTILSESRFEAPPGWTLETGFAFQSGVLWMYRLDSEID